MEDMVEGAERWRLCRCTSSMSFCRGGVSGASTKIWLSMVSLLRGCVLLGDGGAGMFRAFRLGAGLPLARSWEGEAMTGVLRLLCEEGVRPCGSV